jgi:membrane protein implicated in regulation of membrane protease activity
MWMWIISLGAWKWFILAALLFVLEILLPGTFMMWLGLAAILVGVVSSVAVWPWQAQLLAFAAFSIAAIPLWRRFAQRGEAGGDRPFLNRRAQALVGREFKLDRPIVNGIGTLHVDDTIWRLSGPDCPAGSAVRVTWAEGADIRVELVKA